jgi:hypothetical protein
MATKNANVNDIVYIQNPNLNLYESSTGNNIQTDRFTQIKYGTVNAIRTVTATTIAFVNGSPDTITDSGNGFVTAGFFVGEFITISGAANGANNSTFQISGVTAGTLTLVSTATLVSAGAGASITIKGSVTQVAANARLSSIGVSFTRPADTTAYTASDTISNSTSSPSLLTFTTNTPTQGYITRVRLMSNNVAMTGVLFRLHLYNLVPTAINDNSPFTLLYTNASKKIGVIDLPSTVTEGTGSDSIRTQNITDRIPFINTGSIIYGILETLTAFTPTSAQQFYVELTLDMN